jgi:AbrB family looped-hinge helix DNA binding protein
MMEAAITAKGQATIPKPVRQYLGLKAGDKVKFFLHPDGTVVLLPKVPVSSLQGILPRPSRTLTLDQISEASAAGALERFLRSQE